MSDRGDDRNRAGGDRAQEPLVAEREEVLEAPAAAREDDDVDLRRLRDRAQRVGDRGRGARALDVRLGDEQAGGRKARGDGGEHVLLRGGVVAGDEPDTSREARQGSLAAGVEEPFRGEFLLQPLECRQVVAEAEALDREGSQPEVAAGLEQLGTPVDVDALAVREVEAQRVELPAGHRDCEAGALLGILEREEDALPAILAAELSDLAFDPDRGQAREPLGDCRG